ncbi:Transcription antitermination protein NusB [bioreactor metagenome]|uniref:Transcription antitermination protein NusB n=1 Tax=bioreactor metagenome TaxID=1076179 RepID=A0A645DJD9_9ZZZZ
MTRRQAREQAFILLFEKSFQEEFSADELIELAIESAFYENDDYTVFLTHEAFEHLEIIDGYIEKYCKGWSIARLPRVNLSVMRMAVAEMLYCEETPVNVAVNEALEIAKKYANTQDVPVINGILGSVSRDEALKEILESKKENV